MCGIFEINVDRSFQLYYYYINSLIVGIFIWVGCIILRVCTFLHIWNFTPSFTAIVCVQSACLLLWSSKHNFLATNPHLQWIQYNIQQVSVNYFYELCRLVLNVTQIEIACSRPRGSFQVHSRPYHKVSWDVHTVCFNEGNCSCL